MPVRRVLQLHVPLQVASLLQTFVADVAFVGGRGVGGRMVMVQVAVLVVQSDVFVEIARIAERAEAVSALQWLET